MIIVFLRFIIAQDIYDSLFFCELPCSALLPIPLPFQSTGIVAARAAMIIVAMATIYTVESLIAQASVTGTQDYETLLKAIGSCRYKVTSSLLSPSVCCSACYETRLTNNDSASLLFECQYVHELR